MPRRRSAIRNWTEYAALRGLAGFLQCFDTEANLHTADLIGTTFYRAGRRRAQRAIDNIARSFPDWDSDRVEAVAHASMQHMFRMFLVDALVMPRLITPDTWPEYVELGEIAEALDLLRSRQPVILVTGHCGNWEMLGFVLSVLGFPMAALARPLDNPLINDYLLGIREARGLRVITKWGATPELREILDTGGALGFIADQNAGDQGLFVPFFGRLASSYKSIGLLAMRYNAPVVTGTARRVGGLRFEFACADFIRPHEWTDQPDPLFYITARINRAIENMIRIAPEQYLWIHRRWKSRPRHERRGRPVPKRLREQIASLPWLTPDAVEGIIEDSNRLAAERT